MQYSFLSLRAQSKLITQIEVVNYQNLLQQFGMNASMSRRGECYDEL